MVAIVVMSFAFWKTRAEGISPMAIWFMVMAGSALFVAAWMSMATSWVDKHNYWEDDSRNQPNHDMTKTKADSRHLN